MTNVITPSTGDVGFVRSVLTQAGRTGTNVREADIMAVFNLNTIYTDYADIIDIGGVWAVADYDLSGTNYATSGSEIFPEFGKIVLSGSMPIGTTQCMITYAAIDGLTDVQIETQIEITKTYLQMDLYDPLLDYSGSSTYELFAATTMKVVASYFSLLAMNNGNAIQAGFNYRLEDYEIQTKLWGEGMIAETLLGEYWKRATKMISALKLLQNFPNAPIYAVNRQRTHRAYTKEVKRILGTANQGDIVGDVVPYDGFSRWGVILQTTG